MAKKRERADDVFQRLVELARQNNWQEDGKLYFENVTKTGRLLGYSRFLVWNVFHKWVKEGKIIFRKKGGKKNVASYYIVVPPSSGKISSRKISKISDEEFLARLKEAALEGEGGVRYINTLTEAAKKLGYANAGSIFARVKRLIEGGKIIKERAGRYILTGPKESQGSKKNTFLEELEEIYNKHNALMEELKRKSIEAVKQIECEVVSLLDEIEDKLSQLKELQNWMVAHNLVDLQQNIEELNKQRDEKLNKQQDNEIFVFGPSGEVAGKVNSFKELYDFLRKERDRW